jgi:hypothetical protein
MYHTALYSLTILRDIILWSSNHYKTREGCTWVCVGVRVLERERERERERDEAFIKVLLIDFIVSQIIDITLMS